MTTMRALLTELKQLDGWQALIQHTGVSQEHLRTLIKVRNFPPGKKCKLKSRYLRVWDTHAVDQWFRKNDPYHSQGSLYRRTV